MKKNENHKEILLVDDDSDYSELTRTRLEASGYQVSCVSDGRKATELLKSDYQPSLIIMDIEMPDRNGLTTLININVQRGKKGENATPHIPVIVATGLQSEKVREIMMAQNINGYLKKPYDSEELIHTVKSLIG